MRTSDTPGLIRLTIAGDLSSRDENHPLRSRAFYPRSNGAGRRAARLMGGHLIVQPVGPASWQARGPCISLPPAAVGMNPSPTVTGRGQVQCLDRATPPLAHRHSQWAVDIIPRDPAQRQARGRPGACPAGSSRYSRGRAADTQTRSPFCGRFSFAFVTGLSSRPVICRGKCLLSIDQQNLIHCHIRP